MNGAEAHLDQQKYTLDQAATSSEIMQIKAQLEKYGEDIAENEAMVTNTGNKVERLEGDIEAVDRATGNRFLDEEILRQKLFNQVEDSLDEFSEFKKEMDKK
jgi:predicted methyltransferase MtxX (methanogen marker protein 4)